MADITVDLWQNFDFTTLDVTNLAANDHVSDGTWSITDPQTQLSTSTSGEQISVGTFSGNSDSGGTRGLAVDLSTLTPGGAICTYAYASAHADVSYGFYFRAPSEWLDSFEEHDIFYVENVAGVREIYLKMGDDGSDPNLQMWLFTAEQGYTTPITFASDTWYWVTCLYGRTGGLHKLRMYTLAGDLVGAEKTRTSSANNTNQASIGSLIGAESVTVAASLYWDDLVMDWTDATFPLGPPDGDIAVDLTGAVATVSAGDAPVFVAPPPPYTLTRVTG